MASALVPWLLVGIALLSGCSGDGLTSEPPNRPLPSVTDRLPLDLVDTTSSYDIQIHRRVPDGLETFLVIAENAGTADGRNWWFGTFDGVRIPARITQDAVLYYVELTRAFQAGDFSQTIPMIASGFRYDADLRFYGAYELDGRTYHKVFVATLRLSWWDYCGTLCGLGFDPVRVVIVNQYGQVLRVIGDDTISYWVS